METINPAVLRQKSAMELWQMRSRVLADLQANAAVYEGRQPNDYEQALEERGEENLRAVDKALEESLRSQSRDQAFSRYNGVMGAQQLSERDKAADQWFRSAISEKNPKPFDLEPEEKRDFSISRPGLEYRSLWEQRDTLKSTATQALPVSVYPNFMLHLVEQTPVMRAGATVIATSSGEDLVVPKTTAFQTSAVTPEGTSITESDPTLGTVTLEAHKYAAFWQVSRELAEDSPANLLDALARGAATSLALAYGVHLATGNGTGQPSGYANATVSVTGPTGATGGFGSQAIADFGFGTVVGAVVAGSITIFLDQRRRKDEKKRLFLEEKRLMYRNVAQALDLMDEHIMLFSKYEPYFRKVEELNPEARETAQQAYEVLKDSLAEVQARYWDGVDFSLLASGAAKRAATSVLETMRQMLACLAADEPCDLTVMKVILDEELQQFRYYARQDLGIDA
jgi:HK97 family phage major capsid protein